VHAIRGMHSLPYERRRSGPTKPRQSFGRRLSGGTGGQPF
jgi:hypothetical protein